MSYFACVRVCSTYQLGERSVLGHESRWFLAGGPVSPVRIETGIISSRPPAADPMNGCMLLC